MTDTMTSRASHLADSAARPDRSRAYSLPETATQREFGRQERGLAFKVQPLEVATPAKEARRQLSEMTQIGFDEISYSFIVTFVNPTRPSDYPQPEGELLSA
jgi:hypothetical protein